MKAKKNAINAEKPAEIRIKKGDAAQTPALSLGKKNVLLGNYPELLDLRAHKFKNNRVICLSGSDSVESIILPGGQFDYVIIESNVFFLHYIRVINFKYILICTFWKF